MELTLKEEIFIKEIQRQCKFALIAHENMKISLINKCSDLFWYSLQNFLISTANISKILWPRQKFNQRGIKLREYLNIDENSPLKKRTFRNHFEHFD